MNEIRQCWAFHSDGTRCELPAAHPGDHAVERTWTDAQCATPGEFQSAPPAPTPTPVPQPVTKCVACSHSHKGGECKCNCKEHIG